MAFSVDLVWVDKSRAAGSVETQWHHLLGVVLSVRDHLLMGMAHGGPGPSVGIADQCSAVGVDAGLMPYYTADK